jgi:hypothetical protein
MDATQPDVVDQLSDLLADFAPDRLAIAVPRVGVGEAETVQPLVADGVGDILGAGQCRHHQVEAVVEVIWLNR